MSEPLHQIDYAPPRRRPAWLTVRGGMIALLILAAAGAMWVVFPRVQHRWMLLGAQEALLDGRARPAGNVIVADVTWLGSRPTTMIPDPQTGVAALEVFTTWSMGSPWSQAAFFGGRDAGSGQRIVVVGADPVIYGAGQPPEVTFTVFIFEPGAWLRAPRQVNQVAVGPVALPVPPDSGWRLAVLSGRADPGNLSRFLIDLEAGYAGTADTRRMTVVGHLMPDDTVRFDWPADSEPVTTQPAD